MNSSQSSLRNRRNNPPPSPPSTPKPPSSSTTTSSRDPTLKYLLIFILIPTLFYLAMYTLLGRSERHENTVTIVIVGSGLAGLTSLISTITYARELYSQESSPSFSLVFSPKYVKVILMEMEEKIGGNSAKATSGINSVYTPIQQRNNINDSITSFMEDTMKSGNGLSNVTLVDILTKESLDAWKWLSNFDLDLSLLSQCGGHSFARTHREPSLNGKLRPVGWDIINTLHNHVLNDIKKEVEKDRKINILRKEQGQVMTYIWKGIRLIGLKSKNNRITGIKYLNVTKHPELKYVDIEEIKDYIEEMDVDGVILTTGGYGTSTLIPKEYQNIPTTNGPWSKGDGIKIVKEINGKILHLDKIQIHPTGFVDFKNKDEKTKFLAPEALRGHGGILINSNGRRFVNELDTRDVVTNAIFKQEDVQPWLIMNQKGVNDFDPVVIEFYSKRGFISKVEGLEELAKYCNVSMDNLKITLKEYGKGDEFGKNVFPTLFTLNDIFYVMKVTPCIHYTMGGIAFDENARLLNENDEPIKRLYGAGEVTGGLHGANRLAGNSLLECVVFGRRAGKTVVQDVLGISGM